MTDSHVGIYQCFKCDYYTYKLGNWNRHVRSRKHTASLPEHTNIYVSDSTIFVPAVKSETIKCQHCGKVYKYRSGLWKHKKSGCGPEQGSELAIIPDTSALQEEIQDLKSIMKVFFESHDKVVNQMAEQNKIINEMIPKIGSTTKFNINIFLNEQCKDAINMSDFVESLQIKVADLLYTKDNGLIEGISSVMVNGLKQLDTYKRPIHCSDVKREVLYIKDNNEWDKESSNVKLKNAIHDIAYKQRKLIKEWENANPNWSKTEKGKEDWINLVRAVMSDVSGGPKENKIIKNIARETSIEKTK